MASKDKGEGEGRVTYQILVVQTIYKEVAEYFHAFGGPKAPQWVGLIQVDLDT